MTTGFSSPHLIVYLYIPSTVYAVNLAYDIAGLVTQQERNHFGDFFRLGFAADRGSLDSRLHGVLSALLCAPLHGRVGIARCHGVDSDAFGTVVFGADAGEAYNGVFGDAVLMRSVSLTSRVSDGVLLVALTAAENDSPLTPAIEEALTIDAPDFMSLSSSFRQCIIPYARNQSVSQHFDFKKQNETHTVKLIPIILSQSSSS